MSARFVMSAGKWSGASRHVTRRSITIGRAQLQQVGLSKGAGPTGAVRKGLGSSQRTHANVLNALRSAQDAFAAPLCTIPVAAPMPTASRSTKTLVKRIKDSGLIKNMKWTNKLVEYGLRREHSYRNDFFLAAISIYAKYGYSTKVLDLINQMKSEGMTVDVSTYNKAVEACGREGDIRKAWTLVLETMPEDGVSPNCETYNGIILGYGKRNEPRKAHHALICMEKKGVTPDVSNYRAAIAISAPRTHALFLQRMKEQGLTPNAEPYNTAMDRCGKFFQREEAVAILRRMQEDGVPPDEETLRTAVFACGIIGEPAEQSRAILEEMGLWPANKESAHEAQ